MVKPVQIRLIAGAAALFLCAFIVGSTCRQPGTDSREWLWHRDSREFPAQVRGVPRKNTQQRRPAGLARSPRLCERTVTKFHGDRGRIHRRSRIRRVQGQPQQVDTSANLWRVARRRRGDQRHSRCRGQTRHRSSQQQFGRRDRHCSTQRHSNCPPASRSTVSSSRLVPRRRPLRWRADR